MFSIRLIAVITPALREWICDSVIFLQSPMTSSKEGGDYSLALSSNSRRLCGNSTLRLILKQVRDFSNWPWVHGL